MKRIITIQDISGVGKCSVTIAQPLISAMGVECAVLPTAVLSTHTMFSGYTFCDLTDEFEKIADHWAEQNITFDAIYTGYLGSFRQLELVSRFIDRFRTKDTLVVIDPVMGDHGKLYPGFTPAFAKEMANLAKKADLVIPNLTEAAYMLGIPYPETYTQADIEKILSSLKEAGTKTVALTGVTLEEGKTGVAMLDGDGLHLYQHHRQPANFHGTGDLFASVTVGGIMRGIPTFDALCLAADYTAHTIGETLADPTHNTYGVNFESTIPDLIQRLYAKLS